MRSTMVVALAVVAAMLGWVCQARADSVTLDSVADTALRGNSQQYNYGWEDSIHVQNKWQDRTVLIRFDLPANFAGATVNSATLRLDVYDTYFTDGTVNAYRSLQPWVEGPASQTWDAPANWRIYDYGQGWNTYGALGSGSDYDNSEVASASYLYGFTGWMSFDVAALVDNWADNSAVNHGFELLAGSVDVIVRSYSKEGEAAASGNAPELILDYTPGGVIPEPGTLLLIGSGVVGLFGLARRRRTK